MAKKNTKKVVKKNNADQTCFALFVITAIIFVFSALVSALSKDPSFAIIYLAIGIAYFGIAYSFKTK